MNAFGKAMKQAVLCGLAMTVSGLGAAGSADLPKEGNFDYTACWSGVASKVDFSKEHSATNVEFTGVTRSAPPGGMFDWNTFRCVGTNASLSGKVSAINVCEAVDPDGDRRLLYFSSQGGKVVREQVAGTGKYEGMVTEGTVQTLPPFPVVKPGTVQGCNRHTGNYKLK